MHEVIPFYKKQLTRTHEGSKHLIKSNSIPFDLISITLTFDLISIWFPMEIYYKHNMHSQFWKQCHKVATIQNKMHLWFCISLWFLKYCSIAMHWLSLEISLHYNANSTLGSCTSSLHTPWSKFFLSTPFLFFGTFFLLIGTLIIFNHLHLCHSKSCCVACGNKWPHPKGIGHLGLTW